MDTTKIHITLSGDVYYNGEKFGTVVYDDYYNCWRSNHDNYIVEYGNQESAVYALIEFTLEQLVVK